MGDKVNKVLEQRVKILMHKNNVSQADIARSVGIKPQTFGNYVRGRTLPAKLLREWKKVYNEDLEELAETQLETNVSRETKNKLRDIDIIEAENYIGMHRRVFDTLEKNLDAFQKIATDAQKNANDLTQILGRRGGPENGPPQG